MKKILEYLVLSDAPDDIRKYVLLTNQIALIVSVVAFPYIFLFRSFSEILANAVICIIFAFLSVIGLNKFSYYNASRFLLVLSTNLTAAYYAASFGKNAGIQFLFFSYLIMPIIIFNFKEKLKIIVGCCISVACILYLEITNYYSPTFVQTTQEFQDVIRLSSIFFVSFIIILSVGSLVFVLSGMYQKLLMAYTNSEEINTKLFIAMNETDEKNKALESEKLAHQSTIQALEKENKISETLLDTTQTLVKQLGTNLDFLKKENEEKLKALKVAESEKEQKEAALEREKGYVVELEVKSKKLDQSLVIVEDVIKAGKLQQAIQPKEKPKSVALVFKNYAARHLAGDFGYWKDCGAKTLVVMGDVQGKGAEAGFAAGIVADRLSVFAEQQGEGISLEALDTFFRVNIAEHPITRRKAVAVVAVLVDTSDWTLRYLNAGIHTEPILCRKEFGCVQLGCSGPAYGMVDEALAVEVFEIAKGDRFLCMTDGVEDLKNDVGEAFGQARAQVFSEGLTGLLFEEVLSRMDTEIYGFKGNADFVDDISIVVMDVVG